MKLFDPKTKLVFVYYLSPASSFARPFVTGLQKDFYVHAHNLIYLL